jgi:hypothetical protein
MDVTDLMRECNGKTPPSKGLVKGLAREPGYHGVVPGQAGGGSRKDLGAGTSLDVVKLAGLPLRLGLAGQVP